MDIKDRIAHVLSIKNISATQLAEEMEVQRSGISHILSGRNNPSLDFITKLKGTFPEFSLDWLLLGKGPVTISPVQPAKSFQPSLFSVDEIKPGNTDSILTAPPPTVVATGWDQHRKENEEAASTKPDNLSLAGDTGNQKNTPHPNEEGQENKIVSKKVVRMILLYEDQTFSTYTQSPD